MSAPYVSAPASSADLPLSHDPSHEGAHVYPPSAAPSQAVAALRDVQTRDDEELETLVTRNQRARTQITFSRGELAMIFSSFTAVTVLAGTAATLTLKKVNW